MSAKPHFVLNSLYLKNLLILVALGICCCMCFSLAVESGGYSLVVGQGLLTVVAPLAVEPGLWARGPQ